MPHVVLIDEEASDETSGSVEASAMQQRIRSVPTDNHSLDLQTRRRLVPDKFIVFPPLISVPIYVNLGAGYGVLLIVVA